LWHAAAAKVIATGTTESGPITSVAVSGEQDRVAASSEAGRITIWAIDDFVAPLAAISGPAPVNEVVFTPAGDLAAAGSDGVVRFWRENGSSAREPISVDSNGDAVLGVAVSPDGRMLAAATATDGVILWNLESDESGPTLNAQQPAPLDVAFTPDGAAFVSTNRQGVLTLWNTETGSAVGARISVHVAPVWRAAVTGNNVVVSASEDGRVAALDVLDVERACELGAVALDPRARARYLGTRPPTGCRE
jgi:WD40 repeat protein